MSINLYLTADRIGGGGGGPTVTENEVTALSKLGNPYHVWGRECLENELRHLAEIGTVIERDPWLWDQAAFARLLHSKTKHQLAHLYAGTFSTTVRYLKEQGTKVVYTCAAHDVAVSRREHEKLGIPFAELYPHLVQKDLWDRYVAGYLAADAIVCPSTYSLVVLRSFGYTGHIAVIPHGVHVPDRPLRPLPKRFTVGYLGAVGPDKGLVYLLQAWKKLNYRDATLLIGGRDSPSLRGLVEEHGGGSICLLGWVPDVSEFYESLSLYVQPSCSEGFGLEVLEALAHGRPALCSSGCGAKDVVDSYWRFQSCNADALADKIDAIRAEKAKPQDIRDLAQCYTWDKIQQQYVKFWAKVMGL